MKRHAPPVVVIHGFKGAHLDDAETGRRHWLSGRQALGLASPSIRLPLTWEGQEQERDTLAPTAHLGKVLHVPFYGPLLDWCAERFSASYAFSYDWRRDNAEAVIAFGQYLRTISARHGDQPVLVIAHSNGGLITHATWQRHPELFHAILYAATPFGSGLGVMDDLHRGVNTGLNRKIANPAVMFSFVTSYAFFPLSREPSQVYSQTGQRLSLDWFDPETWEEHRWGIYRHPGGVSALERVHLKNALQRSQAFREQLVATQAPCPPIAVLASDSSPTLAAIQRDRHAPTGWNFDARPKEAGDGRVRFSSCLPPEGIPFRLYKTRLQHADVLSDGKAVSQAIEDLLETAG